MSRNGSGVYSLPAGNPVVTGTTISSSWANTTLSDIATALTGSVAADGQTSMTGNLQMGNNKITGLAVATASGDALSYGQAATISALTVSGAFSANGGATLGDASGDALTINSSAVSIPNGLAFSGGNISTANNLIFTGTGNRITGDFSNATIANRVAFQSSGTNASTVIHAIPSGTGPTGGFEANNNSDITNSSALQVFAGASDLSLRASIRGTGTYLPLTMFTGGSERLRIDTSGNVGIGTSSPNARLTVDGAVRIFGTTTSGYRLYVNPSTLVTDVYADGANTIINTVSNGTLNFGTNNTERMRIDSSGNLLVGTTSAVATEGGFAWNTGGQIYIGHATGTSSGTYYAGFRYGSNTIGYISQNGTTAVTYATSSDYRLKENIAPMTGALDKVALLKPCTYTWKVDGSDGQGFIAHELQAVVPDCVTGEKDAVDADGNPVYQGIDTSFLVATLTAAIQEQQAIITELKARVEALENK